VNRLLAPVLVALAVLSACTSVAVSTVADAFAGGTTGSTWSSESDPELVRDALPFGLKTMEALLAREPEHEGLLGSLAQGFTGYAYGFILTDAEGAELAGRSGEAAALRTRAKGLLLRARDYGLRGLEVRHEGMRQKLLDVRGAEAALQELEPEDVPLAYWTAAAWALAISSAKDDMGLVAELPAAGALVVRSMQLDPDWNAGALHDFLISYEAARGDAVSARGHYERALALSKNARLGTHVTWVEAVLLPAQDREAFTRVLEQVVRADVNASPENRLANVLAQRRAKSLLAHADDLFL
jgi:hypothetical protein